MGSCSTGLCYIHLSSTAVVAHDSRCFDTKNIDRVQNARCATAAISLNHSKVVVVESSRSRFISCRWQPLPLICSIPLDVYNYIDGGIIGYGLVCICHHIMSCVLFIGLRLRLQGRQLQLGTCHRRGGSLHLRHATQQRPRSRHQQHTNGRR